MSSAPVESETVIAAPQPTPKPGTAPPRPRWSLPAWLHRGAVGLLLVLVAAATAWAPLQPVHPDAYRVLGNWDWTRADWWLYPLERNAFRRAVVRGDLRALADVPGTDLLWAVGDGGLILHSADGGRHWQQQRPEPPTPASKPAPRSASWSLWPQAVAGEPPSNNLPSRREPVEPSTKTPPPQSGPVEPDVKRAAQEAIRQRAPYGQPDPYGKAEGNALPSPKRPPASAPSPPAPASAPPVLPPGGSATLHDVCFIDARRGVAVGDNGTLLRTDDGGRSWQLQPLPTRATLYSVHFAPGSDNGWAAGDDGVVLSSSDSGRSWSLRGTLARESLLRVRSAVDGRRAWVQTFSGVLLATEDAGTRWTKVSPVGESFSTWHLAADGRRAWGSREGAMLATSDGGANWAPVPVPPGFVAEDLHFDPSGRMGVAVGSVARSTSGSVAAPRDVALLSQDGGATWGPAQTLPTRAVMLSVRVLDGAAPPRIVAAGKDGTLLRSSDGGRQWEQSTAGARAQLFAVSASADGRRVWAAGGDEHVIGSDDGGATWTRRSVNALPLLPFTGGAEAAMLVALQRDEVAQLLRQPSRGRVLASRDGGLTWRPLAPPTPSAVPASAPGSDAAWFAADGVRGRLSDTGGRLWATSDRGASWQALPGVGPRFLAIGFGDDGVLGWGLTVDFTLQPLGESRPPRQPPATLFGRTLHVAADGRSVWVGGVLGRLVSTRNAGADWTVQSLPTDEVTALLFDRSGRRGFATGTDGDLFASGDGGTSWTAVPSGSTQTLRALHLAAGAPLGFAVGDNASIVASADGGASWRPIAPYARYWAPWYHALLAGTAALLALLLGFVQPRRAQAATSTTDTAEDAGSSTVLAADNPVQDKAGDLLGYRTAVEALSSFIRNRATQPRVTIAVSGEWGSGKSSIMRMLQTDLQRAGYRTAWFNAWHHQQEGRALSALFNTVRQQAMPHWWSWRFFDALRVRSRLIWGRGAFYKLVCIGCAVGVCLLLGDLFGSVRTEGARGPWQRIEANFRWHVLQQKPSAISRASLARLDPFVPAAAASAPPPRKDLVAIDTLCADTKRVAALREAEPVRAQVWCELSRRLLWDDGAARTRCRAQPSDDGRMPSPCVFRSGADLLETIEAPAGLGLPLAPSEKRAVLAAAETLPPPPVFRWFESSLLGGAAGFLLLLFTKGVSVYGLQLTAPLRALAGSKASDDGGRKEVSGTVERYRAEFRLLCDALDGRLVIFIDDLDRCSVETVNGMLELTNYLVDVGRCFVVIGAALDRVKKCVRPPAAGENPKRYATEYLRKLVHIELPVPPRRESLQKLAEPVPDAQRQRTRARLLQRAGWALVTLAAAAALHEAYEAGVALHRSRDGTASVVAPAPAARDERTATAPTVQPVDPAASVARAVRGVQRDAGLSAPPSPTVPAWPFVLAVAAVGAALLWRRSSQARQTLRIALGGSIREQDSSGFLQAIKQWNELIVEHDPTPRQVKRFYNRARLFAAYERQAPGPEGALGDGALVGLAALHHTAQAELDEMAQIGPDAWLAAQQRSTLARRWEASLAIDALRGMPPPSTAQVRRYRERVLGVHVR